MRTGGRAVRVALALCAVTGAIGAARPATAADLETLRARAQKVADEVSRLEHELAGLEDEAASLERKIDSVTKDLASTTIEQDEAEASFTEAQERYIARAVEAYKTGDRSIRLALILGADSLATLEAIAEMTTHAAREDANAVDVMLEARNDATRLQEALDQRKQELMAAEQRAAEVAESKRAALRERRAELRELTAEIEKLEEKARAQAVVVHEQNPSVSVDQAFLDILAPAGPTPDIPEDFAPTGVTFSGIASWYGPGFEGNLTASGDVFDSSLFTAASKELPLRSWLYVEHEGRGVVVYVNDRGPYVGDRVLDLSKAAAFAIGISGLGWIEAEVILPVKR